MSDQTSVSAADLISEHLYERWPNVVPINAVVIMEGLDVGGNRTLFAISNADCPPWSLQGMLDLVAADNRFAWESVNYQVVQGDPSYENELEDDDD